MSRKPTIFIIRDPLIHADVLTEYMRGRQFQTAQDDETGDTKYIHIANSKEESLYRYQLISLDEVSSNLSSQLARDGTKFLFTFPEHYLLSVSRPKMRTLMEKIVGIMATDTRILEASVLVCVDHQSRRTRTQLNRSFSECLRRLAMPSLGELLLLPEGSLYYLEPDADGANRALIEAALEKRFTLPATFTPAQHQEAPPNRPVEARIPKKKRCEPFKQLQKMPIIRRGMLISTLFVGVYACATDFQDPNSIKSFANTVLAVVAALGVFGALTRCLGQCERSAMNLTDSLEKKLGVIGRAVQVQAGNTGEVVRQSFSEYQRFWEATTTLVQQIQADVSSVSGSAATLLDGVNQTQHELLTEISPVLGNLSDSLQAVSSQVNNVGKATSHSMYRLTDSTERNMNRLTGVTKATMCRLTRATEQSMSSIAKDLHKLQEASGQFLRADVKQALDDVVKAFDRKDLKPDVKVNVSQHQGFGLQCAMM